MHGIKNKILKFEEKIDKLRDPARIKEHPMEMPILWALFIIASIIVNFIKNDRSYTYYH